MKGSKYDYDTHSKASEGISSVPGTGSGRHKAFLIAVTICLVGFITVNFKFQLQPVSKEIKEALGGISDSQYSALFTAPLMPAMFLSIISGLLVDRIGARKPMLICLIAGTAALWARVFSQRSFGGMFACMFIVGFAAALGNSTNGRMFGGWFAPEKTSVWIGMYMAFCSVGSTIATIVTPHLTGMRKDGMIDMTIPFVMSACIITAVLVMWSLFYRDGRMRDRKKANVQQESIGQMLKAVIVQKDILLGCGAEFFIYGGLQGAASFMGIILADKGADPAKAGLVGALITIGMLTGNLLVPRIVNTFRTLKIPVCLFGSAGAAALLLLAGLPIGIPLCMCLLAAGFFVGGIIPVVLSLPMRIPGIGIQRAGTGGGLIATFQIVGAVLLPTGVFATIAGGNYPLYTILCAVSTAVGTVLAAFLKE